MEKATSKSENSSNTASHNFFSAARVFPKLTVNAPGDKYEQEADAMADKVMRMGDSEEEVLHAKPLAAGIQRMDHAGEEEEMHASPIQRMCSQCEEEAQRKPIMRQATGGGFAAPAGLSAQLQSRRGSGNALPEATQSKMSSAFGADFSGVRVHTGSQAENMSQSIQAKAFTHGSDIYFNKGAYQPGSHGGDKLLAHELTHVVQQGGDNSFIQKESLDERAKKEAGEGSTLLKDALSQSIRKHLPFSFIHDLESQDQIKVKSGGSIWAIIHSSFSGTTPNKSMLHNFKVTLLRNEIGTDQEIGSRNYVIGNKQTHTWTELEEGEYYLKFESSLGIKITGSLWIDVLTGTGEQGNLIKPSDKLEMSTGINTSGNSFGGETYGEYVLRSEPVGNSFIFGTLPGKPLEVTVLDKRSFNKEACKDGSDCWYLIQIRDMDTYREHAIERPPEYFSHAFQMYQNGRAWITHKAIKVFVPFDKFINQIKAFEEGRTDTLRARITALRQFHQDQDLPFDDIIGTPPGSPTVQDRPELSNIIQLLKGPVTGVIFSDGSKVDIAHFFIALDAYLHNDNDKNYLFHSIGSSRAVLGWSGDVGAAIGDYTFEHENKKLDSINSNLLDQHFAKSAPDADLLGNIDGIGASLLMNNTTIATIEDLVMQYFHGITPKKTSGQPEILKTNRGKALAHFLGSYGFKSPKIKASSNFPAINCLFRDACLFGRIWFMNRGSTIDAIFPPENLIEKVTEKMIIKFLNRLENFVDNYEITTIPSGISPSKGCTISTSNKPTKGNPSPPSSQAVAPKISRKEENENLTGQPFITSSKRLSKLELNKNHSINTIQRQKQKNKLKSIIFKQAPALVTYYESGNLLLSSTSNSKASITAIQQALLFLNHEKYSIGKPDGRYGTKTISAVKTFQSDFGIPSSNGNMDNTTIKELDKRIHKKEGDARNPSRSRKTNYNAFPETFISKIDVNLKDGAVTLKWKGNEAKKRDIGPFTGAPGLGITKGRCNDCNDSIESNSIGSNCTPKGTFKISSVTPSLNAYPEALFATYFIPSRGIAFHYYHNVPLVPASHGCVRLNLYPAILINNNVKPGITEVEVSGTWSRGFQDKLGCVVEPYRQEAGQIFERTLERTGEYLNKLFD